MEKADSVARECVTPGDAAPLRARVESWFRTFAGRTYAWSELDEDALFDLLHCQFAGRTDRALALLDEVLTTPGLFGRNLSRRYISYTAWVESGKPLRVRPLHPERLPRYREMIRRNARAARASRRAGRADIYGLVFFCALFGALLCGIYTAAALVVLGLVTGAVARRVGVA